MFASEGTQTLIQGVQHPASERVSFLTSTIYLGHYSLVDGSRFPKFSSFLFSLLHRYLFPPCFPLLAIDEWIEEWADRKITYKFSPLVANG